MPESIAWFADQWISKSQVHLGLDDWGFLQGAVVVDRLRTLAHLPLDVEPHVARFLEGCRGLGIRLPQTESSLAGIVNECAIRNRQVYQERDFCIVLLATPGSSQSADDSSTLIVHTSPIAWSQLAKWYVEGQTLVVAEPRNIPAECWSPHIKTRARLQYYLADRQVQQTEPAAGAVLLDLAGNLTETSIANLLIVENDIVVSPPLESILIGISLKRTLRLLEDQGIAVSFSSVSSERASRATEILLCGTSGCLWPAAGLRTASGMRHFPQPPALEMYQRLHRAWTADLGFDYVSQALSCVNT